MNKLEDFQYYHTCSGSEVCISKHGKVITITVSNEDKELHTYDATVGAIPHNEAPKLRNWFNEAYPQWISVKDRLPIFEGKSVYDSFVLAWADGECHLVYLSKWVLDDGEEVMLWELKDLDGHISFEKVTHWQPLPKPPKGENDEC